MVNADKPHLWKQDVARSVDFYNRWFMQFAPQAYRDTRIQTTQQVLAAFEASNNLQNLTINNLKQHPSILPILRMTTAPPLARDRLIGLAGVTPNLVKSMEQLKRLPPRMASSEIDHQLAAIISIIKQLRDHDILSWLNSQKKPSSTIVKRAATVIADRLCGAVSDPIIRNAQEQRQLVAIGDWLDKRGYEQNSLGNGTSYRDMQAGSYSFRLNMPVNQGRNTVNMPIDVVVMPHSAKQGDLPILIEAKSAGDFTNTNKRRKEEAAKFSQLQATYGSDVTFVLFLCGYFDSGYLGYEAAEGIDWVWEHRPDDLAQLGLEK